MDEGKHANIQLTKYGMVMGCELSPCIITCIMTLVVLIDYSQSHVVIFNEYLDISQEKMWTS